MLRRVAVIGMLLLSAGLLLLAAGTARAEDEAVIEVTETSEASPAGAAIHLPMIESLEPVAESYWGVRSVTLPSPPEVFIATGSDSLGETPGRKVWLAQSVLEFRGVSGRVALCMTYLHERGHNGGLGHTPGDPIMDASQWPTAPPPPKCVKWANTGYLTALGRSNPRLP